MHRPAKVSLLPVLILLVLSFLPQDVHAKTQRLSAFTAHTGPVRLEGVKEHFDLFIPLASTATLKNVTLELKFTRSLTLLAKRSSLNVRLNEATLAQIPFVPDQPVTTARVTLPSELWRPGFNKLTLAVAQHYSERCEDYSAPELWSEVDLHHSTITYDTIAKNGSLTLEDLSGLFSPGIGGHKEALLLTPPTRDSAQNNLIFTEALPTIAQALALRRDFNKLRFSHRPWNTDRNIPDVFSEEQRRKAAPYLPGNDSRLHVLIGTREELKPLLPQALLDTVKGPHLHIDRAAPLLDHTGKKTIVPGGIRLIVSGNSDEELLIAARTLAEMDDRLNPVAYINILGRDVDMRLPLAAKRFLQPDNSYTFEALGVPTRTLGGQGKRTLRVNIPIGADFHALESQEAELLLDFGYGAGMGEGSIMDVYLNGEYIHGHSLNQPGGAAYHDYRITLPIRKLLAGINTLEFDFTLRTPTVPGECRTIPGNHLIVQMLGSSRLVLPKAKAVTQQPNLEVFAGTGYPYISPSRPVPTQIYAASEAIIDTALDLAGKLAQTAGAPSDSIHLNIGIPESIDGDAVILATPEMLSDNLFDSWRAAVGRSIRWPYRILNDLRDSYRNKNLSLRHTGTGPRLEGTITQDHGLGDLGALMAIKNPYDDDPSTLTLFLANSPQMLNKRFADLSSPDLWGQIRGDLCIWRKAPEPVITMQVANRYSVGASGWYERMLLMLSNNPWYAAFALLLSSMLLGLLAHRFLKRRRAQKMAE